MQQLDIFADSRDRVLLNTLADALSVAGAPVGAEADAAGAATRAGTHAAQAGALHAAESAWTELAREFPNDAHLAPARLLIQALRDETAVGEQAWRDAATAQQTCGQLLHATTPAAVHVLGREAATPWLQARWRALAQRARMLPFEGRPETAADAPTAPATRAIATGPEHTLGRATPAIGSTDVHPAALWLRARDWAAAAEAVRRIDSWRHKPVPLAWMAQAIWHQRGPDATWPLLAELAWRAPHRLPGLLQALPDQRLHKLATRFADAAWQDEPIAWLWWPAWLLVEQPLLAPLLEAAQPSGAAHAAAAERAHALLQALLRLERQGRHPERVAHRRELQALHPGLYGEYMATR